ncbi:GNAT family N-acetyltransferase [Treponema sp.]|uniref:GNAT family N-acetyltransferase n=1 Tax=Treponema sp. TaxID=166 RepID=UPI00257C9207|nr:GNAT family N-acetyltransferase [Treponema sp.]
MESKPTENLTIKYNELTAVQFIELWKTVWGAGPSTEQAEIAMKNTLFRVSVFDGGKIVGMARILGDLGLDYFIKDVVVHPEYQKMGIRRLLIDELLNFVRKKRSERNKYFRGTLCRARQNSVLRKIRL